MLTLNLKQVMNARGITRPFQFLVNGGFSRHTASGLLDNSLVKFNIAYVDKLCHMLTCTPNDLFVFKPNKEYPYQPDHPLLDLTGIDVSTNWQTALATMPLNKLKQTMVTFNTIASNNKKQVDQEA